MMKGFWNWLVVLVGAGTPLGKDPFWKQRPSRYIESADMWIGMLSAADYVELADQAYQAIQLPDRREAGRRLFNLRLLLLAASLRNRRGWYLYDPTNKEDISHLAQLPGQSLKDLVNAACELSELPLLRIPDASELNEEDLLRIDNTAAEQVADDIEPQDPVNPSPASREDASQSA